MKRTGSHVHRWGDSIYDRKRKRWYRLCTDGWCPRGKWVNGKTFEARPDRKPPAEGGGVDVRPL